MLYIDHGHYNPLYGYYLVVRVGDHGGFPLAIHLVVPIIRLLGVRVWDVFRLVPFLPRYKEIFEHEGTSKTGQVYWQNVLSDLH